MRVPIIAAGLAVAAVSLGALHVSASRSAPGSQYVLHETWHAFSGNPSSPQPTDVYAFQSVLRVPGAAAVGSVDGYATNLRPPMVAWHATAQLQNGTLTFEGVLDQSRRGAGRLPIVGGTGSYEGARGVAILRPDPSGDDDVELRIDR